MLLVLTNIPSENFLHRHGSPGKRRLIGAKYGSHRGHAQAPINLGRDPVDDGLAEIVKLDGHELAVGEEPQVILDDVFPKQSFCDLVQVEIGQQAQDVLPPNLFSVRPQNDWPAVAIAGAVLLLGVPGTGGQELTRARVRLKNGAEWDLEILNRYSTNELTVQRPNEPGNFTMSLSDIAYAEFPIELDEGEVEDGFARERYHEVIRLLSRVLGPYTSYLDMRSNLTPHVHRLLFALHWAEADSQLLAFTEQILKRPVSPDITRDARLIRVPALLRAGRVDEARALMERVQPVKAGGQPAALYRYAETQLHLVDEAWSKALESASRIVVFAARDFNWLPAGLYLTARGYTEQGAYDVAARILEELRFMFPSSR